MSDDKQTVYDVLVSFNGVIDRQRKVQRQLLKTEDLGEKPSQEKAIEISKSLLDDNKARSIKSDAVRITIQKCELNKETAIRVKQPCYSIVNGVKHLSIRFNKSPPRMAQFI